MYNDSTKHRNNIFADDGDDNFKPITFDDEDFNTLTSNNDFTSTSNSNRNNDEFSENSVWNSSKIKGFSFGDDDHTPWNDISSYQSAQNDAELSSRTFGDGQTGGDEFPRQPPDTRNSSIPTAADKSFVVSDKMKAVCRLYLSTLHGFESSLFNSSNNKNLDDYGSSSMGMDFDNPQSPFYVSPSISINQLRRDLSSAKRSLSKIDLMTRNPIPLHPREAVHNRFQGKSATWNLTDYKTLRDKCDLIDFAIELGDGDAITATTLHAFSTLSESKFVEIVLEKRERYEVALHHLLQHFKYLGHFEKVRLLYTACGGVCPTLARSKFTLLHHAYICSGVLLKTAVSNEHYLSSSSSSSLVLNGVVERKRFNIDQSDMLLQQISDLDLSTPKSSQSMSPSSLTTLNVKRIFEWQKLRLKNLLGSHSLNKSHEDIALIVDHFNLLDRLICILSAKLSTGVTAPAPTRDIPLMWFRKTVYPYTCHPFNRSALTPSASRSLSNDSTSSIYVMLSPETSLYQLILHLAFNHSHNPSDMISTPSNKRSHCLSTIKSEHKLTEKTLAYVAFQGKARSFSWTDCNHLFNLRVSKALFVSNSSTSTTASNNTTTALSKSDSYGNRFDKSPTWMSKIVSSGASMANTISGGVSSMMVAGGVGISKSHLDAPSLIWLMVRRWQSSPPPHFLKDMLNAISDVEEREMLARVSNASNVIVDCLVLQQNRTGLVRYQNSCLDHSAEWFYAKKCLDTLSATTATSNSTR